MTQNDTTPAAPLTPEEVGEKIMKMLENASKEYGTELDYVECSAVLSYMRTLQSQLKTRTEDAERMAEALDTILVIQKCYRKHPCAFCTASKALSSLHHIYPPKP